MGLECFLVSSVFPKDCGLEVRALDAAVDVDQHFGAAFIFEGGRHPGRARDVRLANQLGEHRPNYVRLRSRASKCHFAVYNRHDAFRLSLQGGKRHRRFAVCIDYVLPLRVEARLKLPQSQRALSALSNLEQELPRYFKDLRVFVLPNELSRRLPRGVLLSLSWVLRYGLVRVQPSMDRLKKNTALDAERMATRERGEQKAPGIIVTLDAGDIVLDALLKRLDGHTAVKLAREWYRSMVELLNALAEKYAADLPAVVRAFSSLFVGRVEQILRSPIRTQRPHQIFEPGVSSSPRTIEEALRSPRVQEVSEQVRNQH